MKKFFLMAVLALALCALPLAAIGAAPPGISSTAGPSLAIVTTGPELAALPAAVADLSRSLEKVANAGIALALAVIIGMGAYLFGVIRPLPRPVVGVISSTISQRRGSPGKAKKKPRAKPSQQLPATAAQ